MNHTKAGTRMTGNDLAKMFEFSYGAMSRNLQDLSHQESLARPEHGGNCLNWVLGHVIVARNTILMLAGTTPMLTGEHTAEYQRGSSPEGTDRFLDLATLRGLLDDSQKQLIPALAALSEEQLNRDVPQQYRRPAAHRLAWRRPDPPALSRGLPQRPDRPAAQNGGERRGD